MKKRLPNILLGLIFIIGFGVFSYPTISNQWNKLHQSRAIATYDDTIKNMKPADFTVSWEKARKYNNKILNNTFQHDAFSYKKKEDKNSAYWKVLNINNDGIMGYVSIPKLGEKLPIYHGTSDVVLQIASGHMEGTRLPIGGKGNHSVIAAHRGLPSAKLFSDLDKMENGDKFYIHVLDKVLAYETDQILPMVKKEDINKLTKAMEIEKNQDQITLFTCTPYGVNSHRLLVRGHRVAYHGEEDIKETVGTSMVKAVKDYYMLYLLIVFAFIILISVGVKGVKVVKNRSQISGEEKK